MGAWLGVLGWKKGCHPESAFLLFCFKIAYPTMLHKFFICFFGSLLATQVAAAQIFLEQEEDKKKKVSYDSLLLESEEVKPTLEVNPGAIEEQKKKAKKKKRKKKVFYGEKTKRVFTKDYDRRSRKNIYQRFHILKRQHRPNSYVRTIYYYSAKKKAWEKTPSYKPEYGPLLHGTYQRIMDGAVIEKGIFYYGTKHGRWERYTTDGLLIDKSYYYKGHPKAAEIEYYDSDQKKMKEVIPIQFDYKDGLYVEYYESGRLKTEGQYKDGVQVGRWIEYYDRRRPNLKRITVYVSPNRPFKTDFEPYIEREYNTKGELVIDNRKGRGRRK